MIIKIKMKSGREVFVNQKVYTTLADYLNSLIGTFKLTTSTQSNGEIALNINEIEFIEEIRDK